MLYRGHHHKTNMSV